MTDFSISANTKKEIKRLLISKMKPLVLRKEEVTLAEKEVSRLAAELRAAEEHYENLNNLGLSELDTVMELIELAGVSHDNIQTVNAWHNFIGSIGGLNQEENRTYNSLINSILYRLEHDKKE